MKKLVQNKAKTLLTQWEMRLKFRSFLIECKSFSVKITVNEFYEVVLTGANDKIIFRLESFLDNDAELKAMVILHEAIKNLDLLDVIKERAAIRWSGGLSDSLFDAVICNLKPLNEKPERDNKGEIILKPCSDWQGEIIKFNL